MSKAPKIDAPKIEKNIPIPQHGNNKYHFGLLESVGDSRFYAGADSIIRSAADNWSMRKNIKLVAKKVTENGVVGHRIWRIS